MRIKPLILILLFTNLMSCSLKKANKLAGYKKTSIFLAKENRLLKKELTALKFQINELKNKNEFLTLSNENKVNRSIASITPVNPDNDLVEFHVYRWSPEQLLSTAKKSFQEKEFEKSAQFFQTLIYQFPRHQIITDEIYYKLGISSYESGKHLDWSENSFLKIVNNYPQSNFYRSAKLWNGLINLKQGNKKGFFLTVEEFRKKYRNTDEWKLISRHYDTIYKNYR